MRYHRIAWTILISTTCGLASGQVKIESEIVEGIRPTPLTRPELKRLLEDVKVRTTRIPLSELGEAEREALGEQAENYESRVKYQYLNGIEIIRPPVSPALNQAGSATSSNGTASGNRPSGMSREQDPLFTLDNAFKVELFWIVSRVNNCHYCIGHQESKLLGLGRSEDQIASLDGDWAGFDDASKAAFAFARKFSLEPHLLDSQDIEKLKNHYTEDQILEMTLSMSGNNSINRWKDAIGVPQRKDEGGYSRMASMMTGAQPNTAEIANLPKGSYLTPTSKGFEKSVSKIALVTESSNSVNTCATISRRPPLESSDYVDKMLLQCKTRQPRIALMDDAQTRENIPSFTELGSELPNWVRLVAKFPKAGSIRFESILASEQKGDISPLLKAQLSWILARQDRAWYALGRARDQLQKLGQNEQQIFALDGDWGEFSDREKAMFRLAKNLGNSPVVLSGGEVKKAIEVAGPRDVVQVISFTTARASFNRLTEAAGLPLD